MITDAVILRTLTNKSVLGFGQYRELTVLEIINLQKSGYLRYAYFNFYGITFTDEVLDKLNIHPKYRIHKPGTNPELFEQHHQMIHSANHTSDPMRYFKWTGRNHKIQRGRQYYREKTYFRESTKGVLQAKNHGH